MDYTAWRNELVSALQARKNEKMMKGGGENTQADVHKQAGFQKIVLS